MVKTTNMQRSIIFKSKKNSSVAESKANKTNYGSLKKYQKYHQFSDELSYFHPSIPFKLTTLSLGERLNSITITKKSNLKKSEIRNKKNMQKTMYAGHMSSFTAHKSESLTASENYKNYCLKFKMENLIESQEQPTQSGRFRKGKND